MFAFTPRSILRLLLESGVGDLSDVFLGPWSCADKYQSSKTIWSGRGELIMQSPPTTQARMGMGYTPQGLRAHDLVQD